MHTTNLIALESHRLRDATGTLIATVWEREVTEVMQEGESVAAMGERVNAAQRAAKEEAAANARLFAASPLLLRALLLCRFDSLNMTMADVNFCREAIAAATGAA